MSQIHQPVQRVSSDTPAIVALVLGICGFLTFGVTAVAGVVVAHLTRKTTTSRGLSNAALAVCWSVTGICLLIAATLIIPWVMAFAAVGASSY